MSKQVRELKMGLASRDAYGKTLAELGKKDKKIVVLDADLAKSTKTEFFLKEHPERFFNVGIQEANMVGMAAGFASCDMIPFVSSFACFAVCKTYDQLRMSVAYPNLNVKIVTSHSGISVGEDGASQQSIEDIGLMVTLPNFIVAAASDQYCAAGLTRQAAEINGPVYIRTGRPAAPIVHSSDQKFEFGKGIQLKKGKDLSIITNGLQVSEALLAADLLEAEGVSASVIDMHTIKPLDKELLLKEAKETGCFVVVEEHQVWAGLGAHVAQFVASANPIPVECVGINDVYAESGKPGDLLKKYGLTSESIKEACNRALKRKK